MSNLSSNTDVSGLGSSQDEFRQSAFGALLAFTGGVCLVWQLLTFAIHPDRLFHYDGLILGMIFLVFAPALLWLNRNLILSFGIWAAGFSIIIGITILAYQLPQISIALSLVPLVGSTLFGWQAGLAVIGIDIAALLLGNKLWPDSFSPSSVIAPAILAGVAVWMVGTIIERTFFETIKLFYQNYRSARQELEEARLERLEFKQVREDLLHANREHARLTKQLKVLNQAAEEARRAKEEFVAIVSHELRTPLNMIIGFSEVIAQSPQVYGMHLPAKLLADIASIRRNSQHLLELVNDVLDLSQVDMGNLAISPDWHILQTIMGEAFEVIQPLYDAKRLYLKAELPAQEIPVYCDETRIREVIINLLSNAGRFTEKGGVQVSACVSENNLVVGIRDTGPGISPENQKKLFEPFQQLDSSTRRKYGGSGLGLAISKRFVEMHGGKMWLESAVDQGTTVFFSLPMNPPEPDLSEARSVSRWFNPYSTYEGRSRPFKAPLGPVSPRCIVLEEGITIQRIFERYLANAEICSAKDIEQAAQAVQQTPAQLLVINHPQANELLRCLRTQHSLPFGLPILAFWLPGEQDFADTLGVLKYLIKPVDSKKLISSLDEVGKKITNILILDDHPEVLQLFERILQASQKGYRILRASNGPQGLEIMRKRHPDLMILDLIMPEMSGFEVLKEKSSDPTIRDIPVIAITAQDPVGLPKVSEQITFYREGGLSVRELINLSGFLGMNPETGTRAG